MGLCKYVWGELNGWQIERALDEPVTLLETGTVL